MADLIDREAAYEVLSDYYHHRTEFQNMALMDALSRVPSAQPEIIKCKECQYYRLYDGYVDGFCGVAEWYRRYQHEDDFCSRAERRIDG